MDQSGEISEAIGYWYGARVLCPECFERQGRVSHEGIIPPDDLVGLLTRCSFCGMQLWTLQALERDKWRFPNEELHQGTQITAREDKGATGR